MDKVAPRIDVMGMIVSVFAVVIAQTWLVSRFVNLRGFCISNKSLRERDLVWRERWLHRDERPPSDRAQKEARRLYNNTQRFALFPLKDSDRSPALMPSILRFPFRPHS